MKILRAEGLTELQILKLVFRAVDTWPDLINSAGDIEILNNKCNFLNGNYVESTGSITTPNCLLHTDFVKC